MKTLLHIDDDFQDILKPIGRMLRREGYDVSSQTNPDIAAHIINAGFLPSVIILDGDLGEHGTGREFYETLVPELQERVVFFTGELEFDGAGRPVVSKGEGFEALLAAIRGVTEALERDAA
ncbi:MAG TPA: hypothetical protein VHO25_10510 [Polyangiaceae bacterium]|nr:hypothetical protein [Polyangiaceae bacterium]